MSAVLTELPDIREELEAMQQSRCGICGGGAGVLQLDHDHNNGMIRGLLCPACNNREGRHAGCEIPEGCQVCRWRLFPATAWLGWTQSYAYYSTALARIQLAVMRDRWEPTASMIRAAS